MNSTKSPDIQCEDIEGIREQIKRNFNEVELDLFGLTINEVYSILEKMAKNLDHDSIADLKDENVAGRLYTQFEGLSKEQIIKYVTERFGRGKTACSFLIKKVLPMEIHYRDAERDIVVGKVVYGSQESTHSYAIARFNELLEERLKLRSRDRSKAIIDAWDAGGGGYISCEVTETEGQLEQTLRFKGSSNTYGYVDDETFENWMKPSIRKYLDNAGLPHIEVRRGLE